jgi:hypothetical protein
VQTGVREGGKEEKTITEIGGTNGGEVGELLAWEHCPQSFAVEGPICFNLLEM